MVECERNKRKLNESVGTCVIRAYVYVCRFVCAAGFEKEKVSEGAI